MADLFRFADGFAFPVPVPAGDSSLIDEFLAELMTQLKRRGVSVENSELALTYLGPILFCLVIVQQYLSHPPENDLDIFDLVANGRIVRLWTSHEQALVGIKPKRRRLERRLQEYVRVVKVHWCRMIVRE